MIKVSVIIPAYNVQMYIEEAVTSICRQSLKELEILIIDDGSIDNTVKIIRNLMKSDSRIRLFEQEHAGSGVGRNRGIAEAEGKYIAFCDADDFYYDVDALERMVKACESNNVSICGSYRIVLEDGWISDSMLLRDFKISGREGRRAAFEELQNDYDYQSFLFERNFLIRNNISFPDYLRYQDPPFFVNAMATAGEFWIVPVILYCYRLGHQNIAENSRKIKYVLMGIRDNLQVAIDNDYDQLYKRLIEERLNGQYYESIMTNLSDEVIELLNEIETINQESGRCLEIKALTKRTKYLKYCDLVRPEDAILELEILQNQSFEIYRKTALLKSKGIGFADILQYMGIEEIYVYGAGEIGQMFLTDIGEKIPVKAILDQSSVKQIDLLNDNVPIVVTPGAFFQEISYDLIKSGVSRKKIYAIHTLLTIGMNDMSQKGNAMELPYSERQHFLITGAQFGNKGAQSMLFIAVSEIRKRFQNAVIWYLPVDDTSNYSKELQSKYKFHFLLDGNSLKSQLYEILPQLTAIVDISGYALSSYWENEWYMRILRMAYHYDISLYLMPQSFGPFDFPEKKQEELQRYLPSVRQIYVREESTYETFKRKYVLNNVKLSEDLVLQNKGIIYEYICHGHNVLHNVKALETEHNIGIVPNIRNYEFGSKQKILTLYHSIINWLLEKQKSVYILPHSEDLIACRDIYKMFKENGSVHLINRDMDCIEFGELVKNFQYIIASRFHAIIHAYKNHTPCIAIGWADKYIELLKKFDQEKYNFDIRTEIDLMSLINTLEKMDLNFVYEAEKIGGILPTMQNKNSFDILRQSDYPYFFAALSKDTVNVEASSSGGIFYELCKFIITRGGVIYGVAQVDATTAEHQRADSLEEVKKFRRSKYVKSKLNGCFEHVKMDLEQGKTVMFSGVGCQIAKLYTFLGRKYDKLYTCEVVCHGAPLTETLKKYVNEKEIIKGDSVSWINFRDKSRGWLENCFAEHYASGEQDIIISREHPVHSLYLQGINMELRCSTCKYANLPRIADITLADFWNYEGTLNHNGRGISLVAVNTDKGENLRRKVEKCIYWELTTKEIALSSCRHMNLSPMAHRSNKAFQNLIKNHSFQLSNDLCSQFGEVILADEVRKVKELSEDFVFETLHQDTQEVIYIMDEVDKLIGIITYGYFINNYGNGTKWFNDDFTSVRLREECADEIKNIFDRNKKINRIPILDDRGHLIYEVRRDLGANGKDDPRKSLLPFAKLSHNKINVSL